MNHKLKIASPQIVAQYEHIFKSQMIPPINGILTQLPILDRLTSGGSPALAPITPPPSTTPHPFCRSFQLFKAKPGAGTIYQIGVWDTL